MKRLLVGLVFCTCLMMVAPLTAAQPSGLVGPEEGRIPNHMLSSMGLSGMQPISDIEGLGLRAKGGSINICIRIVIVSCGPGNSVKLPCPISAAGGN